MSWFDATGFANLAKSALKEAQKTIDKALDIKEEEGGNYSYSDARSGMLSTAVGEETESFFASWGMKASGKLERTPKLTSSCPEVDVSTQHEQSVKDKLTTSTSLWGSFTGSFFENPIVSSGGEDFETGGIIDHNSEITKQPRKACLSRTSSLNNDIVTSRKEKVAERKSSLECGDVLKTTDHEEVSLCDDLSELGEEGFSRSKLVVESEDGESEVRSRLSSCETEEEKNVELGIVHGDSKDYSTSQSIEEDPVRNDEGHVLVEVSRRREVPSSNNYRYNRLSIISSESDKKSSESVEVLGSASSECGSGFTTSPDSDMPVTSPAISASSSIAGLRLSMIASSPESVEVITDTLSSVEVLGDNASGRTSRTLSSPYVSPDEPSCPPNLLHIEVESSTPDEHDDQKGMVSSEAEKISPESVEVIPEEEEDEEDASVADDSYTSASESTATATTTVLEPSPLLFGGDISKSPLHKPFAAAVDSLSTESSLYSSTMSSKTDTSSTPRSSQHNLNALDSSYHENVVLSTDVQSSIIVEEPVKTHTGSRTGLQLPLGQDTSVVYGLKMAKIAQQNFKNSEASESGSGSASASASNIPRMRTTTDSSGEGTILGSSSDDEVTSLVGENLKQTSSLYVKTMLADAIGDEDMKDTKQDHQSFPAGDQSPISSESRSDMLKVESEQTSEHTSGDELETTTSSDIEIISSPNGDSSSTHSRHSPAKLLLHVGKGKGAVVADHSDSSTCGSLVRLAGPKVKGHQRELSETSSGCSEEEHSAEVKKLLRRISEMTEIIEVRESRLIELSRINVELQESNTDMKRHLEAVQSSASESQDLHQVREDYTQRLSALERQFQQAIRDKEVLRKQLDHARQEAASRLSAEELQSLCAEKDDLIKQLTMEGEKLSKRELNYCNRIKELKAKETELENTVKNQKAQLKSLSQEVERLKLSLTAKEDMERKHIEAVDKLAATKKRQEKELGQLRAQAEESRIKAAQLAESVEAAHRELDESKKIISLKEKELQEVRLSAELSVRQEMLAALEEARCTAQTERDELDMEVKLLRVAMSQASEEHKSQESTLRQQCAEVLQRLERSEARNEQLAQSVSVATRPLLRQLESLQATSSSQQALWEKQERILSDTVNELQTKLNSISEQERSWREQCASMSTRVSGLESRLSSATKEAAQYKIEMEHLQSELNQLKNSKDKEISVADGLRQSMTEQLVELRREVTALEQQLSVERAATEAEKRRTTLLQDQLKERDSGPSREQSGLQSSPAFSQRSSPTLSFGRASLPESFSSIAWAQNSDDMFESGSTSGRLYNVYDSLRAGNTTSLLEGLQSQLKLRDGEVQQLQWELCRRDNERAALTTELSQLTARLQDQEVKLQELAELRTSHEDVQHKYDALLQMYGEKVEEAQELRLDLEDVKDMYKTQIDQLLKKESPS